MSRAIADIEKPRRGRPRTGATPVMVRLQPDQLAALDAWIGKQPSKISRPEALRRIAADQNLGAHLTEALRRFQEIERVLESAPEDAPAELIATIRQFLEEANQHIQASVDLQPVASKAD